MANTPEQRMWYEISQLNDLVFFDIPEPLLTKLAGERGYQRATANRVPAWGGASHSDGDALGSCYLRPRRCA